MLFFLLICERKSSRIVSVYCGFFVAAAILVKLAVSDAISAFLALCLSRVSLNCISTTRYVAMKETFYKWEEKSD